MPEGRAVFIDRDGALIREARYLRRPEQLRLYAGAAGAVARLRAAGFKVVVVTNQSGVGRGYLTRRRLEEIHRLLRRRLKSGGARIDGLFYCPHLPSDRCPCRKPRIGMLEKAARRLGLDLARCYLVGDKTADVQTARNAGCVGVLVRTGYGGRDGAYRARPHAVRRDLAAAAAWILRAERAGRLSRPCRE
ncbi:MAG: HAD family hydrolase [Elusimicrobia bacterium]|nr:HAD family hydrolase [Elusimicrobiota bacterium]